MSISAALLGSLEIALNKAMQLDPETLQRLGSLHGRVIKLELIGLDLHLFLVPDPGGIQLLSELEGEPDCTLRGTPLDLANMRSSRDSADQLFSGNVQIEGDSAIAHQFGEIMSSLEIDWEEQLSHLTGDVVAHEVGNLTRSVVHWGGRLAHTFGLNLQEYLQEEVRLLPSRYELEPFFDDVDHLRDDVERLHARVARLNQTHVTSQSSQ